MLIALEGISRPVRLDGCEALLAPLGAVLGTWPFSVVARHPQRPVITVRRDGRVCRITSPWLERPAPERTAAGAVFTITAELISAFAAEPARPFCLHAAAVERRGRLIVFPSTERAGKSTLAVHLAARGLRVFADDALPLSTEGEGMALGLAPRLRLPLPAAAGPAFRAFAQAHRGPRDRESLYVILPPELLAPHGATAPVGAIVLLDRKPATPARLEPARRGQGLQRLIVQNFARAGTSLASVDALHALMRRTPCFRLAYSDPDDAVAALLDGLEAGRESRAPGSAGARKLVVAESPDGNAQRYERTPGVVLRALDGDLFLLRPGVKAVFHLNSVAAFLWDALECPATLAATTAALHSAFPGEAPTQIRRDVKRAFAALEAGGLIRAAPARSGARARRASRSAGAEDDPKRRRGGA